jgi:hypothetical protein
MVAGTLAINDECAPGPRRFDEAEQLSVTDSLSVIDGKSEPKPQQGG